MVMITIGICQWMLDTLGVAAVQRASELGFPAMQIGVRSMDAFHEMRDPAVQAAYLEAAAAHHIDIVGMSLGIFNQIALHDTAQSYTVWEILSQMIDAAVAMNINLIYCPSYGHGVISNDDELARTAAMFRRACDHVGDRPLLIATENSLNAAGHRRLVGQVNHSNMRVLIDAYNPVVYGENPAVMIRELQDILCDQFHAKDGRDRQGGTEPIGQGDGDFAAAVQALKDIGFSGYVVCENDYTVETDTRAKADLATLQKLFDV